MSDNQLFQEVKKDNTNMFFYIFLGIVSLSVVAYGHVGLTTMKENCEIVDEKHPQRVFWNNESSVMTNEKILATITGMGYGIIVFLFIIGINKILYKTNENCVKIVYPILSLFLIIISSFLINKSQTFDNTCSIQAKEQSNIIYGLLGSGIGMLIISGLYMLFSMDGKGGNIKNLIIMLFTCIILLIQSVVIVMNNNNCNLDKNVEYSQSMYSKIGYTIASFSVLFIILTIVYFSYKTKKDGLKIVLNRLL
jgi:hypothetical protein